MKFIQVFFITLICTSNLYSQSTFRDYKDEVSGKRITYSKGVILSELENSYSKENTTTIDMYPSFQNGAFYLVLPTYLAPKKEGKHSYNMYERCVYDKYGQDRMNAKGKFGNTIFLIININDGERVLQLPAKFESISGNYIWAADDRDKIQDLKFKIDKSIARSIALANKIEVKVSPRKLSRYNNFEYSFEFIDLDGFRDFALGMKLITKN